MQNDGGVNMKTRKGFVSNSSSSSFIVVVDSGTDETHDIAKTYDYYSADWNAYRIPSSNGKYQFGWEWVDTFSFEGKLNFVGIQLLELFMMKIEGRKPEYSIPYTGDDFDRLYDMVQKVCREQFNFNVKLRGDLIQMNIDHDKDKGYHGYLTMDSDYYIDHQSNAIEGRCMEMFESEDALYNFLRFQESYIRGGNDNS
jgi:hypothetical protein